MANGLAAAPVGLGGSEETKKKYLGMLTESAKLASFCLTEPDAGSDVSGMKTRAVKKGDKYVINGSKCFITNGTYADWFTVYAKTDPEAGHRGISAFVVDADLPGVSVDKKEDKMGQRASNTATISFDEVEIPAENLIGEENKGFKLAMMTLDRTRPGVAAMAVGIARAAFEFAAEYSKERVQFGVPIAMHQAIQFMIADMATKVDAGRLLTWNSAVQLDQGKRNTLVSSEAKRFAADSAMEVTTDAVQVYGGYGFIKEYPVEKLMRDAKIMQLYEGTSQIQRLVIAKEVLLPRNIDERTPEAEAKQADAARDSQVRAGSRYGLGMDAAERAAAGKAARSEAPRSSPRRLGAAPEDRADPVAILERQALSRVPELVPIRYGRMATSPFAFFRGAAAVMAADLDRTPVSGLRVQACGDAHLSNFGAFARARPPPRLRPQRLRRVAAGAVGVGRQAARRQLRDRRPRKRLQAQAAGGGGARGGAHLPRVDARLRLPEQPRGLVRAPRRRGGDGRDRGRTEARRSRSARASPRRGPRTACGRWRSSPTSSTASCGSAAEPPLLVPGEELLPARRRPATSNASPAGGARRLPREPRRPTASTCSTATASATSPARWSASAASAPAPG